MTRFVIMRYGNDVAHFPANCCHTSERDAAAVADQDAAQLVAAEREDWEDRLDTLRGRVRGWRERAEMAQALCTSLVTQLCGDVNHPAVYLRSGGEGIRDLDRQAANTILARVGLVLKSEQRASERVVSTTVELGKIVAHSLFRVVKAPGKVDPENADDLAEQEG